MSDRRERIIDVAIALFNDRGVRAVTTNHVADALRISPGNLYYHFSNKEEILRAIYERAIVEYDGFWREAADTAADPATVLAMLDAVFDHQWKYRCLQRELAVLVRHDRILAERYREMQASRVALYQSLCRGWMAAGTLRVLDDAELDDLVMATWLLGESWLGYLEALGHGDDPEQLRRGVRLIYTVLRPYLTADDEGGGAAQGV